MLRRPAVPADPGGQSGSGSDFRAGRLFNAEYTLDCLGVESIGAQTVQTAGGKRDHAACPDGVGSLLYGGFGRVVRIYFDYIIFSGHYG